MGSTRVGQVAGERDGDLGDPGCARERGLTVKNSGDTFEKMFIITNK